MADEKPQEMSEQEAQRQPRETGGVRPLNQPDPRPTRKPDLEDTYIIDVAGNISTIKTVKGERPRSGTPLGPTGSRVATKDEVEAWKARQAK